MNKQGPIVYIEDDDDDQLLMVDILTDMGYGDQLICFSEVKDALDFLKLDSTNPFLIISDINMPGINGFELRKAVFANLPIRKKCIPYIFISTSSSSNTIIQAYENSVQGFFVKPNSVGELRDIMSSICDYWRRAPDLIA